MFWKSTFLFIMKKYIKNVFNYILTSGRIEFSNSRFQAIKPKNETNLYILNQYTPITIKKCVKLSNIVQQKLKDLRLEQSELAQNCDLLKQDVIGILKTAPQYNCTQIKANGFYSFAKIFYTYLILVESKIVNNDINKRKQHESNLTIISRGLLSMSMGLKEIKLKTINCEIVDNDLIKYKQICKSNYFKINSNSLDTMLPKNWIDKDLFKQSVLTFKNQAIDEFEYSENNESLNQDKYNNPDKISKPLFTPDIEFMTRLLKFSLENETIELIHSTYGLFWLDNTLKFFFKVYSIAISFNREHFPFSIKVLFDRKYSAKIFSNILRYPTINYPFSFWNITEMPFSIFAINLALLKKKAKSKTVYIPKQFYYLINKNGEIHENQNINDIKIDFDNTNENKKTKHKIRCRLTSPNSININESDSLVLHFHGGGFVAQSPDSHEIYLRGWSNDKKITILSVDYALKINFPLSLQNALDVYIWLRTSPDKELIKIFKFVPKKIILVGDSAGANLSLSICYAVDEINKTFFRNTPIKLPDGIVSIYGAFYLCPHLTTSRIVSCIDAFISNGILLHCLAIYSGIIEDIKPNSWLKALKSYFFPSTDPEPWFKTSNQELKKILEKITFINCKLKSPLLFNYNENMKNIPLYLISTEFCPFLDESITMAKKWPGPVQIDVLEDLNHGFLNIHFLSLKATKGNQLCLDRICKIFKHSKKK